MAKFGYIQLEFGHDFKNYLHKWCASVINPKDYVFGEIDGEKIGGLTINDVHITLCYGIPLDTPYKSQIIFEAKNIIPPLIKINDVSCFYIKGHSVKIIYLSINDNLGILKNINEKFSKYVSADLEVKNSLLPHITIGYVSENVDVSTIFYDGPKEVRSLRLKPYFPKN